MTNKPKNLVPLGKGRLSFMGGSIYLRLPLVIRDRLFGSGPLKCKGGEAKQTFVYFWQSANSNDVIMRFKKEGDVL